MRFAGYFIRVIYQFLQLNSNNFYWISSAITGLSELENLHHVILHQLLSQITSPTLIRYSFSMNYFQPLLPQSHMILYPSLELLSEQCRCSNPFLYFIIYMLLFIRFGCFVLTVFYIKGTDMIFSLVHDSVMFALCL